LFPHVLSNHTGEKLSVTNFIVTTADPLDIFNILGGSCDSSPVSFATTKWKRGQFNWGNMCSFLGMLIFFCISVALRNSLYRELTKLDLKKKKNIIVLLTLFLR
jgi:hypothetical protein